MKNPIDREVREVLAHVVKHGIKIPWRSSVRSFGFGEHKSIHKGSGNDFDTFRAMERGDDPRRMNHKHFAKTRERIVRVDRPETQIYSYVLVDVSDTMNFGTARVSKRQLAAELAGSCIMSLNKSKDRVGVIAFSRTKVEAIVTQQVANMEAAYMGILYTLLKRQSPPIEGRTRSGAVEALLGHVPPKRSLVFVISDFYGWTDTDWKALKAAGALHDVVCMHVQDKRERELPKRQYSPFVSKYFGWFLHRIPALYPLQDFRGGTRMIWNTPRNRALYAENFRRFEAETHGRFKTSHCRHIVVSTEEGTAAYPSLVKVFGGAR